MTPSTSSPRMSAVPDPTAHNRCVVGHWVQRDVIASISKRADSGDVTTTSLNRSKSTIAGSRETSNARDWRQGIAIGSKPARRNESEALGNAEGSRFNQIFIHEPTWARSFLAPWAIRFSATRIPSASASSNAPRSSALRSVPQSGDPTRARNHKFPPRSIA